MKRIAPFLVAASLACVIALPAACAPQEGGGDVIPLLQENLIDDDYDNYYEIYVGSFCDSDGNGQGDLNGVTQKLSYVRDMGYTGIWLMPICPSPSYHKYDVSDYMAVDEAYGTMEDFEALVSKAHELGIKVIIDMVFNHSSKRHQWFRESVNAHASGDTENKYYDYYNFSSASAEGYAYAGNDSQGNALYYEARFDSGMPDLNLDNEDVKAELAEIMRFWLVDENVDGFRFDAVRYFWYGDANKSADFVGWLKETADGILAIAEGEGAHAYFVGEDWASETEIATFYERGKGSTFFAFDVAQYHPNYIVSAIRDAVHIVRPDAAYAANRYFNSLGKLMEIAGGGIPVPFLDNHDTTRIASTFAGETAQIKFAYGLCSMYSGNTFTYYGDEIGAMGVKDNGDETLRVGMLWTDDTPLLTPYGSMSKDTAPYYSFGSVERQLADPDSILNYYKRCNNARNAFPAIMRGTAARVDNANGDILVFTKTYQTEQVTIVINFSTEETVASGDFGTLRQDICVNGKVVRNGNAYTMPGFSIAIFA